MSIPCVEPPHEEGVITMSIPQSNPENPTIITEPSDDTSLYNLRKELFKAAMNQKWKKVLELYRNELVQGEYITRDNDTLLHVAISSATEKTVLDLLNILVEVNKEEMCQILRLQNEAGDTPLHLAAVLGREKVCRRMTKMCPGLVTSARNNLKETPLFSAVRHGKKNAFFALEVAIQEEQNLTIDEKCLSGRNISHCRSDDGTNILHYAIRGDQFDLAYEIIRLYPQLVNFVNSSGETALHTLANKPSVFKSGARFGLYDTIIYYCTITEPLKIQFVNFLENEKENEKEEPSDIQEDEENPVGAQKGDENKPSKNQKQRRRYPQNYGITIFFFKIIVMLLGIGLWRLQTIRKHKQKHRNAKTIMKELVDHSTLWEYEEASGGKKPDEFSDILFGSRPPITSGESTDPDLDEKTLKPIEDETVLSKLIKELGINRLNKVLEKDSLKNVGEKESTNIPDTGASASPVLVAAKSGITEIVKRILKKFPVAVKDKDKDEKNIVLLAVEHRQVHVYKYMLGVPNKERVFGKVDKDNNNALHLAAKLSHSHPWSTGAALQMQWELKWYKYVFSSLDLEIFAQINKEGKTPREVFAESHDKLIKDGISWLTSISQSCSTVAALFATVAFPSVSTVPGGPDQQSGFPILVNRPIFQLFVISSLVALCFSVTSIVMFLAILTSSFKVRDFEWVLPVKLFLGLTSLFIAIAFTLVSFCVGDFFLVEEKLKFVVYPIFAVMCFPVTFFAVAHYPLYISLIKVTIKKIPEPEVMQDY